jgi:hypothetical protein
MASHSDQSARTRSDRHDRVSRSIRPTLATRASSISTTRLARGRPTAACISSADLYVLQPVDPSRGNGTLLFEIANRGRKGLLGRFNRAGASQDPRPRPTLATDS